MIRRNQDSQYVGINNDLYGGMTDTGKIIRDAWAFELIPETETCEGWLVTGIEDLWRQVNEEWEKYQFSVGALPDDIRQRYMRIQLAAVEHAKSLGWDAEIIDDD